MWECSTTDVGMWWVIRSDGIGKRYAVNPELYRHSQSVATEREHRVYSRGAMRGNIAGQQTSARQ